MVRKVMFVLAEMIWGLEETNKAVLDLSKKNKKSIKKK